MKEFIIANKGWKQMVDMIRRRRQLTHTHTQNFGGYRKYWKLYKQPRKQYLSILPTLSRKDQIKLKVVFSIKTIWWLLIKPIGSAYSYKVRYEGEYVTENSKLFSKNMDVEKTITHKLLDVPFFSHKWPINTSDIKHITNNQHERFDD